ncbi:MAG: DNA methyltransferase [Candidatus Pacebacteria bacterium]|nr:DNA methyltransferase [Candidatus Paceibacterota bacterium]
MPKQKKLWKKNKLICGDNLEELSKLPKNSVDLIYIDPPFFTHKQYEVVWGDEAEVRSYKDRWEGGVEHYIGWLKPRVQVMYEVLKKTGSFYIHCDWHANSHIRIMLDEIFGGENFQNEIIWNYGARATVRKSGFPRKHDTIFFYTKSKNYIFNSLYKPYKDPSMGRYNKIDSNGRHFALIKRRRTDGTVYYGKCYPKEGAPETDVWDISLMASTSNERVGYPTQKPEALLEKIIKASSNEGDVVADFFCGCGTTIAVAQRLGRKWIGIDISPTAIKIMERRLKKSLGTVEGINYTVVGLPTTVEEVRKLEPFEFQNWVVIDKMRANASRKKVGDMGLDGYYPESILTKSAGIQVKQSDKVGRNVVDNFETALKRAKYKKGYIVAFSFTRGAHEEVARIKNKGDLEIKLITIKELLEKKRPIV